MFSYPVKFFHNGFKNAPVLSNGTGNLTALLDAVLVNGFNTVTVTSLSHSSYLATAAATAHGFLENQIIEIAGANEAGYNGQWRIVGQPGLNSFQFMLDSKVITPTTATGTITSKTPGLNFETVFTGTNKRVYRSKNILSNRFFFKVDDDLDQVWTSTYARYAKVGMFESMSDVDTWYGNYAPLSITQPNVNWVGTGTGASAIGGWHKWYYAGNFWQGSTPVSESTAAHSAYSREWSIVGDDRGFYIFVEPQANCGKWGGCFTDFISNKPSDAYNTIFSARDWYTPASTSMGAYNRADHNGEFVNADNFTGKWIMRGYTGVGGAVKWAMNPAWHSDQIQLRHISGRLTGITYPNPTDNSLLVTPIYIKESTANIRGKMPGLMWVAGDMSTFIPEHTFVTGLTDYPGKTFMNVRLTIGENIWAAQTNIARSNFMIDITGPWY